MASERDTAPVGELSMDKFVKLAQDARDIWPNAVVVKNIVGNLAVVQNGEMVGWLDLLFGEVNTV